MNKLTMLVVLMVFAALSCSKPDNTDTDVAPSNLTLTADVSTDSSGAVSFVASATNAIAYSFDYGNSTTEVSATGIVNTHYTASGVYMVTVVAQSKTGKKTSKSIVITVKVVQGLVWADEFDGSGPPNPAKWGYDIGANNGWGNNESEYYTNRIDNSVVSDGTLKIILKKESYQGSAYTSARILSAGKFSFKYGKVEARAKLPAGGGTWPAIWMLGDNIFAGSNWPACGEIDIMEHVGNQLNRIFSTLHHPGHSGGNGDGGSLVISNATTEFHTYSMEWSATTIKFFVDNQPIYTFVNNSTLPFNQTFFFILNVAMGGNFGGTPDPTFTSAQMEIDYIRVYQ
jgi:hypothetical protein